MKAYNFFCEVFRGSEDKTQATVFWYLYNGCKQEIARINDYPTLCWDAHATDITYHGGSLHHSISYDPILTQGHDDYKDENGRTILSLHFRRRPGMLAESKHKFSLWGLEYEEGFYQIETDVVSDGRQYYTKTIRVYDCVPEYSGDMKCYRPLAYIDCPKTKGNHWEYFGYVAKRLPIQLCMGIVSLPFTMHQIG